MSILGSEESRLVYWGVALLGPVPHLIANLFLELLDGDLGLQDPAYALPPRLLEGVHLALDVLLPPLALDVDDVNLALGVGEIPLQAPQPRLELVVADEPGVLPVGVEELQVLAAGGEVGVRDAGVLEDFAEAVGGRVRGGSLLGLVAGKVEGLQGGL